ncbi:MAG: hypothetical protein ABSE72_03985 [Bacteroidales bacterium]|jgi:hypothetical protein
MTDMKGHLVKAGLGNNHLPGENTPFFQIRFTINQFSDIYEQAADTHYGYSRQIKDISE